MFRLRFPAAALLIPGLLALVGLGGYLVERLVPFPVQLAPAASAAEEREPDKRARPPVIAVLAAYPGATAEEVEQQVTIPLEVTFAGMPRLKSLRSQSLPGLCELHVCFQRETEQHTARQEVCNRLQFAANLPPGVAPRLGIEPGGAALRYLLISPLDRLNQSIYTLHDLRALQDGFLTREFRRLPGVADVSSRGGAVKRYEIHPDPDRLRLYGVTLQQLAAAVANGNVNVGGAIEQGQITLTVRGVGLIGGDEDPVGKVIGIPDPDPDAAEKLAQAQREKSPEAAALREEQRRRLALAAAAILRAEDQRRIREIRALVVTTIKGPPGPVTVEDLVEGGRTGPGDRLGVQGVIVGRRPREDRVAASGEQTSEDAVGGVVWLRPGEDPRLLRGVQTRIQELNALTGRFLPGVRIEPYFVSTDGGKDVLWVHGRFPVNTSPERMAEQTREVRKQLCQLPEVERIVSRLGRSEDGEPPQSPNLVQLCVRLRSGPNVPAAPGRDRPRTRAELAAELDRLLTRQFPGRTWLTTTTGPEELAAAFPGVAAEHLLKILGPDLAKLETLADQAQTALLAVPGVEKAAACPVLGLPRLDLRIDLDRCKRWGVRSADVATALQLALQGKVVSQMVEGGKTFDITLRWPRQFRDSETSILDIPIDSETLNRDLPDVGTPALATVRVRVRDLVSPVGKGGKPDPGGNLVRAGAAAIYREDGTRLLPVGFGVRGRPSAEVRAAAAKRIAPLLEPPYRIEWAD